MMCTISPFFRLFPLKVLYSICLLSESFAKQQVNIKINRYWKKWIAYASEHKEKMYNVSQFSFLRKTIKSKAQKSIINDRG